MKNIILIILFGTFFLSNSFGQKTSTLCNRVDIEITNKSGDLVAFSKERGEYLFTMEVDSILLIENGSTYRFPIEGETYGDHPPVINAGQEGLIILLKGRVKRIRYTSGLKIEELYYFE